MKEVPIWEKAVCYDIGIDGLGDGSGGEGCRHVRQGILSQSDLYEILPFGKTKITQLIKSGQLPVVKIGKDYITTYEILKNWVADNIGQEIYY